jgi:CheY-like chemotaxis protein
MKTITFLWIDDMQNWTNSVQNNLNIICPKYSIDLHVINAPNGEDIVQKCMMFNFDAVLMDYHMEPFNGDKYIRDIRDAEHLETIPIIFYSQDNATNLDKLVNGLRNIITVYRPNLEDKIVEMFFS